MPKTSSPKKVDRIAVRLDKDTHRRLMAEVKRRKVNVSDLARDYIRASLPPPAAPACKTCGKPRNKCDHYFHGDNR